MTALHVYFSKSGRCYILTRSKSGRLYKKYLGKEVSTKLFKAFKITDPTVLLDNEGCY